MGNIYVVRVVKGVIAGLGLLVVKVISLVC